MSKEVLLESKTALFLDGKQITDYEYTDTLQTEKEIVMWSEEKVCIYSKETGKKLFEYIRSDEKTALYARLKKHYISVIDGQRCFSIK